MRILRLLIDCTIFVALVGCTGISTNKCVPPAVATVPASMDQRRLITGFGQKGIGRMPNWWTVQPSKSQPFQIDGTGLNHEGVSGIAVKDGTAWIAFLSHVLRYRPDTGETKSYQILDENNKPYYFDDILFTKNGELWVVIHSPASVRLAHYDIQSDQFKIVLDNDEVLKQGNDLDYDLFVQSQVLVETPGGNLLVPLEKNIVSFDPRTNTAVYLLPKKLPSFVSAIVVSGTKAWFTVGQDADLRSVDLKTRELINYGHTNTILDDSTWHWMSESYRPIAVDKLGRIWMGYFARLVPGSDGKYTWEQVKLPPEFVIASDPDYNYIWAHMYSFYTSSDGTLWFITEAGLVMYDSDTNRWCKSMPIPPSLAVTDDGQGNLWMAISSYGYNGLYILKNAISK